MHAFRNASMYEQYRCSRGFFCICKTLQAGFRSSERIIYIVYTITGTDKTTNHPSDIFPSVIIDSVAGGKKMKRTLLAMLAGMVILGGCSSAAEQPQESEETAEETTVNTETEKEETLNAGETVGAWEINDEYYSQPVNEEDTARFETALAGLDGVGYIPVTIVADQLVSGRNYAYLALGTTVTQTPESHYYIVTVYEPLEGDPEVLNIARIRMDDIHTIEETAEDLLGGWHVIGSGKPGSLGPDGEAVLADALTETPFMGAVFMPVALLAIQVVAGMNYRFLCYGTVGVDGTGSDDRTNLYIVDVRRDEEGKTGVTDISLLDLPYYVTPAE